MCVAGDLQIDAQRRLVPRPPRLVCAAVVLPAPGPGEAATHTRETAEIERRAAELRAEWFEGKSRVGLTAGASAPEILVREVIDRIRALGAVSVRKMDGIEETLKFPLPKGLKLDHAPAPAHIS